MNADSVSSFRSSVSEWLDSVKHGSDSAARKIWERYVEQLVREANRLLTCKHCGMSDGDDIAQEAFAGFFRGIQAGRFTKLHDRDDLWKLLIVLANRRVIDCKRREWALRRSGQVRDVATDADGENRDGNASLAIEMISAPEPTPESAEQLLLMIQTCFPALADEDLRQIALDRFANYSVREISSRRHISQRSVERKLKLIRAILQREAASIEP